MAIREGAGSRRVQRHPDRRLALAILDNAWTFHAMSLSMSGRTGDASGHYLGIAIELGLKAYLLHRGIRDQWNRIHIGHDLIKAFRSVRRSGLRDLPDGLEDLVRDLNPVGTAAGEYRDRRGLPTGTSEDLAQAVVSDLLVRVSSAVRTGQE